MDAALQRTTWRNCDAIPMGEGVDGEIEVRQLYELDDFAPSTSVECFGEMEAQR